MDEDTTLENDGDTLEPVFAPLPEDLSTLSAEALGEAIESYETTLAEVTAAPQEFVTAEYGADALLDDTRAAWASLTALRAELASRTDETVELTDEQVNAFAEAAAEAAAAEETDETEVVAEAPDEVVAAAVVAQVPPVVRTRASLPRPTAARTIGAGDGAQHQGVSLVAAGGATDIIAGTEFGSDVEIAEAMVRRHASFGMSAPGSVEKFSIAKADWTGEYGAERRLGKDEAANLDLIAAVTNPAAIKREFVKRIKGQIDAALEDLTASGGLCAPVTPYYNLQYISVADRPVMSALPSFNADRGGLRYARPAALSAVTTAVGLITAEEDGEGGSSATKSCQVIPCPPFQETDVDIIYHCLQFGNLGARAFPELVAQWNNLVLAAHARLAESNLLTQIDAFSTQVTAASLGLGAVGDLLGEILTAANGMRSRNRMSSDAVLRIMLPYWSVDLLISDTIRTQFQRFDTDRARIIALLRSFNIEPTFYIDGANGRGQVYGTQGDGALLPFPPTVVWYLFPEGSFLYLDGGTLELGIVRDSVLNKTNDFQIFGETFENVAFVGVESLAVVSTVCDSGAVTAPVTAPTCPIDYSS